MTQEYPKLRPLDIKPFQQDGQDVLLLRDPLALSEHVLGIPQILAPLLALCDGTRDIVGIHMALSVRWGVRIDRQTLLKIIDALDAGCLLENERSAAAMRDALEAYRRAPERAPTMAGGAYPAEPESLCGFLDAFDSRDVSFGYAAATDAPVRGVVSPHIDYARGGPVYRAVWSAASEAARAADLAIIFGTDHYGGLGAITPTLQSYATPYGLLPTATRVVEAVVQALGEEKACAEELHHRNEHSIELAAVWLHHARAGRPIEVAPILCGSFAHFVAGDANPATDADIDKTVRALHCATLGRNVLVIAAADLGHIGPAFGGRPVDVHGRALLGRADEAILGEMAKGDAEGFFRALKAVEDRNNVCGLPPIYLALRFLGETRGEAVAYHQCPADERDTSWVSVAGMVWH